MLWSTESGREIRRFDKQDAITYSVVFTPDGRRALSGGSDKLLKLWDILTGKVVRTFEGHLDTVVSVAISPDGALALSGGADKTMKLWEIASGKMIRSWEVSGGSPVAFTPAGKSAVSKVPQEFGYGDSLKIWDIASGEAIRVFSVENLNQDGLQDQGMVRAIAISPDGAYLLSSADWDIRVWDLHSGELLRTIEAHHSEWVTLVAFSPDGQTDALPSISFSSLLIDSRQIARAVRAGGRYVFLCKRGLPCCCFCRGLGLPNDIRPEQMFLLYGMSKG